MNMNDWNHFIYDLHQTNRKHDQKMKELEEKINLLEQMMQEKGKSSIDRIEYHFDQLKIENLNGALHIGLSPSDLANMEGLEEGNLTNGKMPMYPGSPKQELLSNLTSYLHEKGPEMMRNLAKKYNKQVDENYFPILIQDIENQLPERIAFHENEARNKQNITAEDELQDYIAERIKHEINHSLTNYMGKKDENNEH